AADPEPGTSAAGGSLLVVVNHYQQSADASGTPTRSGKRPGGSAVVMALNVATGALTTLPIRLTAPAGSGSLAWLSLCQAARACRAVPRCAAPYGSTGRGSRGPNVRRTRPVRGLGPNE